MKGAGINPGPATYISLLNVYAEKGDIDSFKKVRALPQLLQIYFNWKEKVKTCLLLICLFVVFTSFCQTLDAAESSDCTLMDRDLMQVIFTLAKAGHQQHLPEVVDRLRHERGYIPGKEK